MGFGVAMGVFSALYQLTTGQVATYDFAPAGVTWWTGPVNVLTILVFASAIIVPHEWLHGRAIRYYGGEPRYRAGVAHFSCRMRTRRLIIGLSATNFLGFYWYLLLY